MSEDPRPHAERIATSYRGIWDSFIRLHRSIETEMEHVVRTQTAQGDPSPTFLHDLVKGVYRAPYDFAPYLSREKLSNAGSVTGLFFEQNVSSVLIPFVRSIHPTAIRVVRNGHEKRLSKSLPRDPDLYFELDGRRVVVEMKAAPKKRDLVRAIQSRKDHADLGVAYFLIGGWVIAQPPLLTEVVECGWASFFDVTSEASKQIIEEATLDRLAGALVASLMADAPPIA